MPSFRKKLWQWIGGLRTLKYIHFARDHFYHNIEINQAIAWLLNELDIPSCDSDTFSLLEEVRQIDRDHLIKGWRENY